MELISYTYSIPYLIFFGYLILLMFWEFHFINKNINVKYIRWAVIIGFLFFFGLRGWVYADWINYFQYFESIPTLFSNKLYNFDLIFFGKELYENFGYSFVLLNSLSKTIFNNYLFFQFFLSVIDIILLNILIRRYSPKYYVLPFILFTAFWGINLEINIIRTIKCILIFLLSIKYIEEKKMFKYFGMIFIAYGFHYSAIVLFPLYFILQYKWRPQVVWTIISLGFIVFWFQIHWLDSILNAFSTILPNKIQEKIIIYMAENTKNTRGFFGFFERLITFLVFYIPYKKWIKENKINMIFINLYIVYFNCILFASEYLEMSARLSVLFIASYWFLYPRIFIQFTQKQKVLFLIMLITIGSLKIIIENNNYLYQYQNILFGIDGQQDRKHKINIFYNENSN